MFIANYLGSAKIHRGAECFLNGLEVCFSLKNLFRHPVPAWMPRWGQQQLPPPPPLLRIFIGDAPPSLNGPWLRQGPGGHSGLDPRSEVVSESRNDDLWKEKIKPNNPFNRLRQLALPFRPPCPFAHRVRPGRPSWQCLGPFGRGRGGRKRLRQSELGIRGLRFCSVVQKVTSRPICL